MEFRDLGIDEELLHALSDAGYTVPTPIQEQAIPAAVAGKDVLGPVQARPVRLRFRFYKS